MACYDELTLSIAADGELPLDEHQRLVAHLQECAACRRLLSALETEAAALREALGEAAVAPPEQPRLSWAPGLLGLVAAGVGSALTLAALDRSALPAPLGWLHPVDPLLALSLLSSLTFHLVEGGVPTMLPNVAVVAAVVATLALLALALRRKDLKPATVVTGLLLLLVAAPAQATVTRVAEHGSQRVVIGATETIDDTLVAAADSVVVEGVVKGDLIALAREVRVTGRVTGSLVALAKHLELDGQVDGDVYALQESLSVRGTVGRSIHAGAKRLVLEGSASVGHDVRAGAEEARIGGVVGRAVTLYAKWAELDGKVGGAAFLRGERAAVRDSAQVGGALTVTVPRLADADVAARAAVQGTTQVHEEPWKEGWSQHAIRRLSQPRFYLWQALWLVSTLLTGALLHWIAPGAFEPQPSSALAALKSMGVGFLVLLVTPVAAILAAITIIGLPLALITLAAWVAALFLASVLASGWLGRLIIRRPALDLRTLLLALLVGQLVLRLAHLVPVVGGLVGFVALVLGLGLAAAAVAAGVRRLRPA
jgi:cytoskeletal protein CcmA (bactofilin family)